MASAPNSSTLEQVVHQFAINGRCVEISPIKAGHINETYCSRWLGASGEQRFIHQHINENVFPKVDVVMNNIAQVLDYLAELHRSGRMEEDERLLHLIRTQRGELYLRDTTVGAWRTYNFLEGTESFDICPSAEHAYQAARTLSRFVRHLRGLGAEKLGEPIHRFQDSRFRYEAFDKALSADPKGRVKEVKADIEFASEQRETACCLINALHSGAVPLRVTHADPKVNNVMFDVRTKKGVCVVDLDTCMPGTLLYDFGDLVRSTSVTTAEDETDLSKIEMSMEYFRALVAGYLDAGAESLTPAEIELFPLAPRAIAITLGVRFLTDHINGDTYFRIHRPGQNLDRARSQFQIARSMAKQEQAMREVVGRAKRS